MKKFFRSAAMLTAALALPGAPALAQTNEITIGISISTTGPAAALGIPERNALDFVPKEIGGAPLRVIVLDDGGDPTAATTNARRFERQLRSGAVIKGAFVRRAASVLALEPASQRAVSVLSSVLFSKSRAASHPCLVADGTDGRFH